MKKRRMNMVRRNNRLGTYLMLVVFAFAAYGSYVIWNKKETKRAVTKVERSVKAAQEAW